MAEYALKHPMVWLVHFPFTPRGSGNDKPLVEEGIVLNVKYSLKGGNALVIFSPSRDLIVELPLKTIIRKLKKIDVTPFQSLINKSFEKNMEHISVNTKRLLRVSLSISVDKITATRQAHEHQRRSRRDLESGSESGSEEEESDEESDAESDDDSQTSGEEEEEEDVILDFKVDIESPTGREVRGECCFEKSRHLQKWELFLL